MELTKAERFHVKVACRFKRQQGKHLKTPLATQTVFGITELLEAILLHLLPQRNDSTCDGYSDMLTLLHSQRVSTAFKNTIKGSPSEPTYAAAYGLPDVNPLIFNRQHVSGNLLDKGKISGIRYTTGFVRPHRICVATLPRGYRTLAQLNRRCMPPGSWQRMVVLRPETAEVVPPVEILHVQVASYGWRNGWRAIVVDEVNRKAVVVGGEVASVMLARVAAWAIHNP
ncbi:hypothetical protein LTR97_007756 [Elasticomyces elasticus]|uniref:Uncharacterized protein n=1 Tax=Elasticomyces elasticus TaxID=574655 RepID=A0AAN8A0F7_9PEZI|nr:hypothetical protein LTR97_007756 [Elasticomyces elasticus]